MGMPTLSTADRSTLALLATAALLPVAALVVTPSAIARVMTPVMARRTRKRRIVVSPLRHPMVLPNVRAGGARVTSPDATDAAPLLCIRTSDGSPSPQGSMSEAVEPFDFRA